MRHSRPSLFQAFATGFFWAGASTLTAVGLYYYLAPPADAQYGLDNVKASIAEIVPGLARWTQKAYSVERTSNVKVADFAPDSPVASNDGSALKEAQTRVAQQQADVQAQHVLVRSIQQELHRVGCYGGSVDGNWTDGTRSAMNAFNDSVQVKLPLKSPDYILLTMLQGHARQACNTTPADKSQVAARNTPRIRREVASAKEGVPAAPATRDAWTTTVTSQPPAASQATAARSVLAAAPPVPVPQANTDVPLVASVPALPGRMAIGAPRPILPSQQVAPSNRTLQLAPQYAAAPQAVIARPAPVPQPQARPVGSAPDPVRVAAPPPRKTNSNNGGGGSNGTSGGGNSSSSRGTTFSNLSRNAP